MGASQEIRFKIGGDTASLEKSFAKLPAMAEAAGRKAESAFNRSARYGAAAKLNAFRESQQYTEASTIGKIKIVTNQLSDLAYARSKTEKGTASYLNQQLAIEQKLVTLRKLQKDAQAERAGGVQMPSVDGGAGTDGGAGGSKVSSLVARFGLAAVSGIASAVGAYFARSAAKAEGQEQTSKASLENLRNTLGTMGGLAEQLKQGRAKVRDASIDENLQKQHLADLRGEKKIAPLGSTEFPDTFMGQAKRIAAVAKKAYDAAQNALNPAVMAMVDKAQEKLETIRRDSDAQFNQNKLIERELNKQTLTYFQQLVTVKQIVAAQRTGRANAVELAKIERDRVHIQRTLADAFGTQEEKRAAKVAELNAAAGVESAGRAMAGRQQEVAQTLTADAATGRTFANGAPRGRSETERLAQRAEQYRQRARAGVLTGASGVASFYTDKARDLEGKVSERLARGSEGVAPPKGVEDLSQLPAKIENSNKLLEAIKTALTSVKVE